jgi:starch synthase (maltosyl-transferring)
MKPLGNDRWRDEFSVEMLGRYQYTVEGWIDRFQTWRGELLKRVAAGQDVYVDLLIGAVLIEEGEPEVMTLACSATGRAGYEKPKNRPEGAHIALDEEPLGVLQRYPVYRP